MTKQPAVSVVVEDDDVFIVLRTEDATKTMRFDVWELIALGFTHLDLSTWVDEQLHTAGKRKSPP